MKDGVYEQLARVTKALAAPKRLELLDLLAQAPRTVEALAELAGISVANASQHLKVLKASRLVDSERRGVFVRYRLADESVAGLFVAIRGVAEARLAEVAEVARAYFDERGAMEPVATEELARRVERGEVTLLDVRPEEEFRAGHIAGAISVPLGELEARLRQLPKGREVVAYCRGPYCVMALEAAELLRKKGFRARRLELGVPDWRAMGGRVAIEKTAGAR